ncbi:MAG: hypothetical protein K2K87_14250 [Lachnospiraceae bacterium]|nr:hypothetical protein [Lachnospiraceae bacterium]
MNTMILVILLGGLVIGAIILAVIITRMLEKSDSIELIQGKLENSDSAIADAISYLKITNEWSK